MTKWEKVLFEAFLDTALVYSEPCGESWHWEEMSNECYGQLRALCSEFWDDNRHLVLLEFFKEADPRLRIKMAAYDLWLTLTSSDAGFWDGSWPYYGDLLTEWCDKSSYKGIALHQYSDGTIDIV